MLLHSDKAAVLGRTPAVHFSWPSKTRARNSSNISIARACSTTVVRSCPLWAGRTKFASSRRFAFRQQAFTPRSSRLPEVPTAEKSEDEDNDPSSGVRQEQAEEDPTPFYEPLLRSLVLGLGTSIIFESGHVALEFFGLIWKMGYDQTVGMLPRVTEQFAPLFVGDHFAALSAWLVFYTIEAAAIYSILKQHPHDDRAAAQALRNSRSLPKRMLPSRLSLLKAVLRIFRPASLQPALAGSAASRLSPSTFKPREQIPPAQPTLEPPQASAFRDDPLNLARAEPTAPGEAIRISGPQIGSILLEPKDPEHGLWNFVEEEPPRPFPRIQEEQEMPEQIPDPQEPVSFMPGEPSDQQVTSFVEDKPIGTEQQGQPKPLAKSRQDRGLKPGQLDPSSVAKQVEHRSKELRERRMYLKNFWYAAALSEDVKDKPVRAEVCGEEVVLWRSADGSINCISNACPHRGAPLSTGWLETHNGEQCVVCPYHGWAFDKEGVCQLVPAAENMQDRPKQSIADVMPVEEKGGFVWFFYGDKRLPAEERPDIPFVPELVDPIWRPVYGEIEFDCAHWSVFENAIDMAHIHYLHGNSFGNKDQPQIRDMTSKRLAWGVEAAFRLHNKPVNALWNFSKVPDVKVTAKALLPSTSVISFTLGNGLSFITFVNTVPINAHKTINRFCLIRTLAGDHKTAFSLLNPFFNWSIFDRFARSAMLKILTEDKAMVESLRPQLVLHEAGVRADIPQQRYRALRQEYINLGYGVDPKASRQADNFGLNMDM